MFQQSTYMQMQMSKDMSMAMPMFHTRLFAVLLGR